MPQMAPLMWLTLMLMTITSLLMITIYTYFNKVGQKTGKESLVSSSTTNKWMW
uniref:ATPase 8 n=1 Tax=Cyamus gracilis TaxID=335538 RepID=Q4FBS0_CYAGR|nr:ATPase 8 [Cyamus gracilis]AAZ05791.1 ATPase 8 [Cyamus gracilis]